MVAVGDSGVGKSALLLTYYAKAFPFEMSESICHLPPMEVRYDNVPTTLTNYDTGGSEQHEESRLLVYPNTNVFLLCFSCADPDSLEHIRSKWIPEIVQHMPKAPFILIATKTDLREDDSTIRALQRSHGRGPLSREEENDIADDFGAAAYLETSSLRLSGVREVFLTSIRIQRGT